MRLTKLLIFLLFTCLPAGMAFAFLLFIPANSPIYAQTCPPPLNCSDYGDPANAFQWCSCASSCGDSGSTAHPRCQAISCGAKLGDHCVNPPAAPFCLAGSFDLGPTWDCSRCCFDKKCVCNAGDLPAGAPECTKINIPSCSPNKRYDFLDSEGCEADRQYWVRSHSAVNDGCVGGVTCGGALGATCTAPPPPPPPPPPGPPPPPPPPGPPPPPPPPGPPPPPPPGGCGAPPAGIWRPKPPPSEDIYICHTDPGRCPADSCVGLPYKCNPATGNWELYRPPGEAGECTTVCFGLCATPGPTFDVGAAPAGLTEAAKIFTNVVSMSVYLAFMVLFIMLVWAGFKYLTSGGEPKAVHIAHQTIVWAFLGVLFLAIAYLTLRLIAAFTGIPVTIFNIKIL